MDKFDLDNYMAEIFERLDRVSFLAEWEPRDMGNKIRVICPQCKVKEAYIFKDGREILCPRQNECGRSTSIMQLLVGDAKPHGSLFVEAVKKLTALTGMPYRLGAATAQEQEQYQRAHQMQAGLSSILHHAQSALLGEMTKSINSYLLPFLATRKLNLPFLVQQGFGLISSSPSGVASIAQAVDADTLKEFGLYTKEGHENSLWNDRLIIPFKNKSGRVVSFAGRDIAGRDAKHKYLNAQGFSIKTLGAVGCDEALKENKDIVIVEGWLDPFKARQHGRSNLVAVGSSGTVIDAARWELLYSLGARKAILAFDDDDAGHKGIEKAIKTLDDAKAAPRVYILNPANLFPAKDPDEFLDSAGVESWDKVVGSAVPVDTYRAHLMAKGHDMECDQSRAEYLAKCSDYAATVKNPIRLQSLILFFYPTVGRLTRASADMLIAVDEEQRNKRIEKEKRAAVEKLLHKAAAELNDHGPIGALSVLRGVDQVEEQFTRVYVSPLAKPSVQLDADDEQLRQYASRDVIGLAQHGLPTLNQKLLGLRGMVLLAGGTNVGKTVMLAQLSLDVLVANPDACVIFVSLEMSTFQMRTRMRCFLARCEYPDVLVAFRTPGSPVWKEQEQARADLEHKFMSRMRIMHEENFGEINCNKILKEAELLKAETGCNRCMVVLDHIGKLRVPASVEKAGQLQADKWQMEEALKVREWLAGDPIIAAVEIRKGKQGGKGDEPVSSDDIMGSSRRAYDADNILIWNRFSDALLYGNFGWSETDRKTFQQDHAWEDVDEKELKKPEVKRTIRCIRNYLENEISAVPGRITIDKVRDGGRKGIFDITVLFKQNRIIEGIHGETAF